MDAPPSEATTLVALLRAQAQVQPDAPAYAFRSQRGEAQTWTYGDLARASAKVAAVLAGRVAARDRVLLLEPPGLDYLAGFFGILEAGAIAVPLLPPRSNRNLERVTQVVAATQPAVAWAPPAIADRLRATVSGPSWLHRADGVLGSRAPLGPPTAEDVAFVQFTSGSTGAPRGVVLRHRMLLHNLEQLRVAFELDPAFVCVGWLPLQHDMGLIGNVLAPLYMGTPCTLMAPETFLMRPAAWLEAISDTRATVSGGPDFAYALCADRVKEAELAHLDLTSWRVAFTGAEPVRAQTLEKFTARFQPVGFRRQAFFPCYGLAEATLLVASAPVESAPKVVAFDPDALEGGRLAPTERSDARWLVGHGGPHIGQRLAVVEPEARVEVGPGEIGEIWVSGPSVSEGYFGSEGLDRPEPAPDGEAPPESSSSGFGARLESDPDAGVWLRTGDLGAVHGEHLFVTGRSKDLIILGGRNIYPQDVERAIEAAHPAVQPGGAIAFSVEDGDRERLVAAAELARVAARQVDVAEVVRAVTSALFHAEGVHLDELVFLRPEGLPRTTSGKPRRIACRRDFLAGRLARLSLSPMPSRTR